MVVKYRFRYEDCDVFFRDKNGKLQRKDEMIWEYDHLVVGISQDKDHYIINHYNKNFDKSEYTMVNEEYKLEDYSDEWFYYMINDNEVECKKEKANV